MNGSFAHQTRPDSNRNSSVGSASSRSDASSTSLTGSYPSPYPLSHTLDTESPTFSSARFFPNSRDNATPHADIKSADIAKAQSSERLSAKAIPCPPRRSISGQRCNFLDLSTPNPSNCSNAWAWVVTKDIVSPLPAHYPPLLPTTSIRLDNVAVETISRRISDFMAVNSILCSHHCSDMGRITCRTATCLKFTVQLWSIDGDERDDGNNNRDVASSQDDDTASVIVEIERRDGCPIEMQRIRRGLIRCCTGHSPPKLAPSATPRRCQTTSTIVKRLYEDAFSHQQQSRSDDVAPSSTKKRACDEMVMGRDLECCINLLESSRLDQNYLGMEGLRIMTDPSKVCPKKADWVARCLIFGKGQYGERLRNAFENYLVDEAANDEWPNEPLPLNDSPLSSNCTDKTKTSSLLVLRNSLEIVLAEQDEMGNSDIEEYYLTAMSHLQIQQACSSHSCSPSGTSSSEQGRDFWTIIIDGLVHYIENSQTCAIKAALAHRCLTLLKKTRLGTSIGGFEDINSIKATMEESKAVSVS